jgi:hypothetical protein
MMPTMQMAPASKPTMRSSTLGPAKTSRRAKTVANLRRTRQIVSKGDGAIISAGAELLKALSALETGTRIELNSRTEPDESRELILKID